MLPKLVAGVESCSNQKWKHLGLDLDIEQKGQDLSALGALGLLSEPLGRQT